MKDGEYTVKKIERDRKSQKVFLKGEPKTDFIWTYNVNLRKGSIIDVKSRKISKVKRY